MKNLFIYICTLGIIITGCQTEPEVLTSADRQAIIDVIDAKTNEMFALGNEMNQEKFDKMFDFYLDTDDSVWMGNPAMMISNLWLSKTKAETRQGFQGMVESRSGTFFEDVELHYAVPSDNCVIQAYTANYYIIDPEGNPGEKRPLAATAVWIKKADDWKILHFHQSWE